MRLPRHPLPATLTILPSLFASPVLTAPHTPLPSTFAISALWAYTPSSSLPPPAPSNFSTPLTQQDLLSWMTFQIHDGGERAVCSVFTEGEEEEVGVGWGYVFWECADEPWGAGLRGQGEGDDREEEEERAKYSFAITPDFGALSVKKSWWVSGTYMTGYATQDTNWVEGDGGNVTVEEHGKLYARWEAWQFEITRLVA